MSTSDELRPGFIYFVNEVVERRDIVY